MLLRYMVDTSFQGDGELDGVVPEGEGLAVMRDEIVRDLVHFAFFPNVPLRTGCLRPMRLRVIRFEMTCRR